MWWRRQRPAAGTPEPPTPAAVDTGTQDRESAVTGGAGDSASGHGPEADEQDAPVADLPETQAVALDEADESTAAWVEFPEGLRDADRDAEAYEREVARLTAVLDELKDIARQGQGLPRAAVERQATQARAAFAEPFAIVERYRTVRATVGVHASAPEPTPQLWQAVEELEEILGGMETLAPSLIDTAESLEGLRERLLQVREELRTVRARLDASLHAARQEMAAAGATLPGRHALEQRLAAAQDVWKRLDDGTLAPTAERTTLRAHEELEAQVAELRDDIEAAARA